MKDIGMLEKLAQIEEEGYYWDLKALKSITSNPENAWITKGTYNAKPRSIRLQIHLII